MRALNATPPFGFFSLVPVEEVMDVVEADEANENQIDGDDVVEEPRHDQNQDAGNKRDKRRDMGSGDDHDLSFYVFGGWDGANWMKGGAGKARPER
jgi:hypothetical protein